VQLILESPMQCCRGDRFLIRDYGETGRFWAAARYWTRWASALEERTRSASAGSDPATEDLLYEVESVRRFAGVDSGKVPNETTTLNFRRRLEGAGLGRRLEKNVQRLALLLGLANPMVASPRLA